MKLNRSRAPPPTTPSTPKPLAANTGSEASVLEFENYYPFAFLANTNVLTSVGADAPEDTERGEPDFSWNVGGGGGGGGGGGPPDPARVEPPPEPVEPFVPFTPVYIVYLGATKHDDPNLVAQSHLEILKSVLRKSEEAAKKSLIYNYQYGFSGFAAKLRPDQAERLKNHPEVITLVINRKLVMQTTRTWDYLGLFSTPSSGKGLVQGSNMGSGAVIGVIDSGIWSESGVFDDSGYGPTPKQWKGQCVSGDKFKAEDCNKKLIGAKYYMDGLNADLETRITSSVEHLSPRDHNGHGTQVSSTVAGSTLSNLAFPGLSSGLTMRGAAPKAHIAIHSRRC
ncbi:Subtilase family protein [Raphanus sativus]|nr:Subtilase family protein [Raphanus sativus]